VGVDVWVCGCGCVGVFVWLCGCGHVWVCLVCAYIFMYVLVLNESVCIMCVHWEGGMCILATVVLLGTMKAPVVLMPWCCAAVFSLGLY